MQSLSAEKVHKCFSGRGFAMDPSGELTVLPRPTAGFSFPGRGPPAKIDESTTARMGQQKVLLRTKVFLRTS